MKKNIFVIITLLLVTQVVEAQQADRVPYTARHLYNLSGPVACVTTSRATILRFDGVGELIDEEEKRVLDYTDDYNHPFVIEYPEPYTRHENNQRTDESSRIDRYYTFDRQGRIAKSIITEYVLYKESVYEYPDDKARFPSRIKTTDSDDGGTIYTTTDYRYLGFDTYGNWTKRQVTENSKYQEYHYEGEPEPPFIDHKTESYEETAEYIYY